MFHQRVGIPRHRVQRALGSWTSELTEGDYYTEFVSEGPRHIAVNLSLVKRT